MSTDSNDTIELELDATPSYPQRTPGLGPLASAIVAVRLAKTRTELEAAILPARAWPEGSDKAKLRAVLKECEARIRGQVTRVAPPAPVAEPVSFKAEDQAVDLTTIWGPLWAGLAQGLHERPYQRRWGTPMATQPPTGNPADMGRIRQAMPVVATPVVPSVMPEDNAYLTRVAVRKSDIVAGAKSDGSGVLIGWMGFGEMTRGNIAAVLASVGLPTDWTPKGKTAHNHAAAALAELTNQGRILRAERGRHVRGTAMGIGTFAGLPRNYVARWTVGNPTHGQVGEHMGEIILTAALTVAGNLDCEGNIELCEHVRVEFNRRIHNEVLKAGEVTDWLRETIVTRFGGVRLGVGWYIPHSSAVDCERLCEALSNAWGQAWILPALPVSTSDQLRKGLVRGLTDEADAVLAELEAQRVAARKERPGSDIGPRAAASMLARVREVFMRSRGYAELLGPEMVAVLRGHLGDAVATLEPLCDDTAQRFSMLDLT